ncbi:MAG: TFIIB-type zinc ribbon-containing protein [Halobacteriales archaeon]
MKIRGRRRCGDCGEEWSYYETDSVACPTCGSLRSVGIEDGRTLHTDAAIDLDLTEVRADVDARPLREVAADAEEIALRYVSTRGFVHAGELRPLDETAVAASQLRHVAAHLRRSIREPSEAVEAHFLALLAGAPAGDRPEDVPEELRAPHGLAIADVVTRYRDDVTAWLEENPREVDLPLEALRDHGRRIEALDGDVPTTEAEGLLRAAREVGAYLREDDESALVRARDRLGDLGE